MYMNFVYLLDICIVQTITNLTFVGKSEYLVSASRGSNPQLAMWSMSNLSATWSYRLDTEGECMVSFK